MPQNVAPKAACDPENCSESRLWIHSGKIRSMKANESRNINLMRLSEQLLEIVSVFNEASKNLTFIFLLKIYNPFAPVQNVLIKLYRPSKTSEDNVRMHRYKKTNMKNLYYFFMLMPFIVIIPWSSRWTVWIILPWNFNFFGMHGLRLLALYIVRTACRKSYYVKFKRGQICKVYA